MANPFSKGWKYLTSSLDMKIDENADPMVQIQQAANEAKKQHEVIEKQATQVIGSRNQLAMKLDRLLKEQAALQDKARQAIQLSDQTQAAGDSAKAKELLNAAEIYASQLVSAEQQLEETKVLHQQAVQAAEQATEQVKQSEARLKEQLGQIDQLRTQVEQTKLHETTNKTMDSITELSVEKDVPSLDQVREKIERRYANAVGAQELMQATGRYEEVDLHGVDMKAADRLAQIRAELSGELTAGTAQAELTSSPEATSETENADVTTEIDDDYIESAAEEEIDAEADTAVDEAEK
ncbi:phage shock protein A (PspA) family protein [Corynebacterium kutscheri]|uniref:Phage shock protein A (PspA) family protein n=1 Tax=Corynebacterium kutscheri TaxID=35755 RepID=A0A0F6TE59_9CORY|nr:PspA/IM30 family protein [Corynebacterium kutscheri]AKE42181.1 phage shock protein A (PspA) family protein [Corynebacterium kutscheri]VEH10524.1 phage shock protein A [Corynebacterium kutscheri]